MNVIEGLLNKIDDLEKRIKRVEVSEHKHPMQGVRVYNNADIEISNDTATALTFNSERWDTAGMHSTSSNTERLTCTVAGKYLIGGHVRWEANASGYRSMLIYLNNTSNLAQQRMDATAAINHSQSIVTLYDLAVDDYVTLQVRQTSGGALDVMSVSASSPEFWMQRVA